MMNRWLGGCESVSSSSSSKVEVAAEAAVEEELPKASGGKLSVPFSNYCGSRLRGKKWG